MLRTTATAVAPDRPFLAAAVAASEWILSLFTSEEHDLWMGDHVNDPRDPAVLRGVELLEDEGLISSEGFGDRLTPGTRLTLTRAGRELVQARLCTAKKPAKALSKGDASCASLT